MLTALAYTGLGLATLLIYGLLFWGFPLMVTKDKNFLIRYAVASHGLVIMMIWVAWSVRYLANN